MACEITYKSVESGIRSKVIELINDSDTLSIVDDKVIGENFSEINNKFKSEVIQPNGEIIPSNELIEEYFKPRLVELQPFFDKLDNKYIQDLYNNDPLATLKYISELTSEAEIQMYSYEIYDEAIKLFPKPNNSTSNQLFFFNKEVKQLDLFDKPKDYLNEIYKQVLEFKHNTYAMKEINSPYLPNQRIVLPIGLKTKQPNSTLRKVFAENFNKAFGHTAKLEAADNTGGFIIRLKNPKFAGSERDFFDKLDVFTDLQLNNFVKDVATRLGIQYKIVNEDEIKAILSKQGILYNNEPGVTINGVVYYIQGKVGTYTAIHELMHPMVQYVRLQKPELYRKLINDIKTSTDPQVKEIIKFVDENYPHESSVEHSDELLVRVAQTLSQKPTQELNNEQKTIWEQIQFLFRKFIRWFGSNNENKKVDISSLNTTTSTVQDIVNLFYDLQFSANLTDEVANDIGVFWNRINTENLREEEIKELINIYVENTGKQDKNGKDIWVDVMDKRINQLRISDIINTQDINKSANQNEAKYSNPLDAAKKNLEKLKKAVKDGEIINYGVEFSHLIYSIEEVSENLLSTLKALKVTVSNELDKDTREKINTVILRKAWQYKNSIITTYGEVIKDAESIFDKGENQNISEKLTKIAKAFKLSEGIIDDFLKDNVIAVLKRNTQVFAATIVDLKKAIELTDVKIAEALVREENPFAFRQNRKSLEYMLSKIPQTEKDYLNLAKGGKEVGLFTMLAESMLNNPSLTVTTLGIEFSKAFNQMGAITQVDSQILWNDIVRKAKETGIDPTKFNAFHEEFTILTKTIKMIDGVPTEHNIFEMLHETKTSEAQTDKELLKHKAEQAGKEYSQDKTNTEKRLKFIDAKKEYLIFLIKYMNDDMPLENLKARLFWVTDSPQFSLEEKLLASDARIEAYKKLQEAQDYDEAAGTEESEKELFNARQEYTALYSEKDINGLPKTGTDLKIAQIFKEYKEKYKDLETFEYTPRLQSFENDLQELKDIIAIAQGKLDNEKIDSPELKARLQKELDVAIKDANNFIKRNVNIGATKQFYETRTAITEQLHEVQFKLNDILGLTEQPNIKEKWKQVIEITSKYRNDERIIAANTLTDGEKELVTEFLRDIELLKEQFSQDKFAKVKVLTDVKETEYRKLKAEMLGHIEQLSQIQTTEPTKYYLDELNKQYSVINNNDEKITFDTINDFNSYEFIQNIIKQGVATPNVNDELQRKNQFELNIGKKVSILYQSQRQKTTNLEASWRPLLIEAVTKDQFTAFELDDNGNKVGIEKTFNLNDRLVAYEFEKDKNKQSDNSSYKESNQFITWFLNNHLLTKRWVKNESGVSGKYEYSYKKLYIWGQNVPVAEIFENYTLADAIKANDYISMWSTFKSKLQDGKRIENGLMFELRPKGRYQRREIKNKTEKIEGVTVDNKGNWLPKNVKQLKDGIGDNKYINQKYIDLKQNNPKLFELLELFTKYHISNQENAMYNQKLYMQMPRIQKATAEIVNDPTAWWDNVKFNFQELFQQMPDETDENNTQPKSNKLKDFVTNVFNKVRGTAEVVSQSQKMQKYIPTQNVGMLETKNTSTNFSDVLFQYAYSNNLNELRNSQLPIFEAFKNSMEKAGNAGNNTYKMIDGFEDIFVYGINNKYELGREFHKIAFALMKPMLFSSLSLLNVPANFKNFVTANAANRLKLIIREAGMSNRNILTGDKYYASNLMNIIRDAWSSEGYSLPTVLAKVFQFNGKPVDVKYKGNSVLNSFKDFSFMGAGQNAGEESASYMLGYAMLASVKVNQTIKNDKGDEVIQTISYLEAFELNKEGNLVLKQGIDESQYGIRSNLFAETVNKIRVFQAQSQGQYGALEKTIGSTFTIGAFMSIMRKYLVPVTIEQFGATRVNATFGTVKRGNFIEFGMQSANLLVALVNQHPKEYWETLTTTQKGGVLRTAANLAVVVLLMFALSLLGFDPDDKNKWKKLKQQSWLINMLILETLMIKSEMESFIPLPGLGTDELGRQFSLGAPQRYLKKYITLINHAKDSFSDEGYYKTKSGAFDKGESKLKADLLKMFFFKSWQVSPEIAIKEQLSIQRQ